jgi:hypothetical protein
MIGTRDAPRAGEMTKVVIRVTSIALLAALSLPLRAQGRPSSTAPSSAVRIEGVTLTAADLDQLFRALHQALKPNDRTIPIAVHITPAADMPSYDKDSHYAGMHTDASGAHILDVWISKDLNGDALHRAIESAFLLAIADGGYAGSAFKQLYDIYAAKDAQLPANAPDPYLNRHKFAGALLRVVNASTPSPSP